MGRPRLYLLDQFALVERTDGCWEWPFTKNGAGRAMFGWRSASRQLYEEIIGPLAPAVGVLHSCDNPGCVNPDHWFPGDQLANVHDAIKKGRFKPVPGQPAGSAHALAKLSGEKAAQIKAFILSERSRNGGRMPNGALAALSQRSGVGASQLLRIANGQRWGKIL